MLLVAPTSRPRCVDAMTNETVVLRASARSRACSSPQPANATGVGQFERSPVAAAPRRRWSLGMAAASSCPQPLYGHTNVPVRERRGALRQRPYSATDRSNPPKQGPAARSYISSNGTRTSTVPYTYVGVVVTVPLLAPSPSATIGGRCRAARGRTLDTAAGPWVNTRRTERSRKSTGGLIIEPSNAVHTTPTQDGPSHPPPPTHRTLLCHLGTHPDRSPRWPTSERGSFRFEGKCRANGGWRRCESRVRVRKHERQRVRAPCFHRDLHVQITQTNLPPPPPPHPLRSRQPQAVQYCAPRSWCMV